MGFKKKIRIEFCYNMFIIHLAQFDSKKKNLITLFLSLDGKRIFYKRHFFIYLFICYS